MIPNFSGCLSLFWSKYTFIFVWLDPIGKNVLVVAINILDECNLKKQFCHLRLALKTLIYLGYKEETFKDILKKEHIVTNMRNIILTELKFMFSIRS